MTVPEISPKVRAVIDAAPPDARAGLMHLRGRIFSAAAELGITLEEALRWGQPSYLAPKGSTLRIGLPKTGGFAIYAHCATTLISDFAALVPAARIEGNRGVHFADLEEAQRQPVELLITAALRYHLRT